MGKEVEAYQDRGDQIIGWTLVAGLVLSVSIMIVGLVMVAASGNFGSAKVLPLDRIIPNLGDGKSYAVLDLGILTLFASPLAGVLAALVTFASQKDFPFILVSMALLILLAVSILVALH